MPEMNELLEEAIGRCTSLSDELNTTIEEIHDLLQNVDEVEAAAKRGADDIHQRMRDLVDRIDTAEETIETRGQDTSGHLEALVERAGAVRTNVGEALERVRAGLEQADALRVRLGQETSEHAQGLTTDVNDVTHAIDEVQADISTRLKDAGDAINEFHDAVATVRTDLDDKKTAWMDAANELETTAKEQTRTWVTGLETLLTGQSHAMLDMANRIITEHNDAMEALKAAFATEAAQNVADAVAPLHDSLTRLTELGAKNSETLGQRSEEVLQRVRAALPVLEQLKTAFETSNRLD
jgi:uncharacterized protein YoxC